MNGVFVALAGLLRMSGKDRRARKSESPAKVLVNSISNMYILVSGGYNKRNCRVYKQT